MKIFISAAEASSDNHGAALLKALQLDLKSNSSPHLKSISAFGIGGPKLKEAGLEVIIPAQDLMVMGFFEIVSHIPQIYQSLNRIVSEVKARKPDVIVVIDYPDFHFRLARKLKNLNIPMIYYIPPKIWVWRKSRSKTLKKFFSKILCVFPFEENFYKNLNIPVKYVGNPLVDELPLSLSQAEARALLKLSPSERVLTLMPGSRTSELKHHLILMLESARDAALKLRLSGYLKNQQGLTILLPFSMTSNLEKLIKQVVDWGKNYWDVQIKTMGRVQKNLSTKKKWPILSIQISQGNSAECLVAADSALVKSGTSTLEAALLGCPHVIVYKVNRSSDWIFKNLVRYRGPVGLVNIIHTEGTQKRFLVPEIVGSKVNSSMLAEEIISLFTNDLRRKRILNGLSSIRDKLSSGGNFKSPSQLVAKEVIEFLTHLKNGSKNEKSRDRD